MGKHLYLTAPALIYTFLSNTVEKDPRWQTHSDTRLPLNSCQDGYLALCRFTQTMTLVQTKPWWKPSYGVWVYITLIWIHLLCIYESRCQDLLRVSMQKPLLYMERSVNWWNSWKETSSSDRGWYILTITSQTPLIYLIHNPYRVWINNDIARCQIQAKSNCAQSRLCVWCQGFS